MRKLSILIAVFIFFQYSCFSYKIKTDTICVWKTLSYSVANACFAPDGKSIYVTDQTSPRHYFKYDLSGKLIDEDGTLGGVKQFFKKENSFYNYDCEKISMKTRERVGRILINNEKPSGFAISEEANIGVAFSRIVNSSIPDNKISFFNPIDMKIIKTISHPSKQFQIDGAVFSNDGKQLALSSLLLDSVSANEFTCVSRRVELWDVKTMQPISVIFESDSALYAPIHIRFSPEGESVAVYTNQKLVAFKLRDCEHKTEYSIDKVSNYLHSVIYEDGGPEIIVNKDGIMVIEMVGSSAADKYSDNFFRQYEPEPVVNKKSVCWQAPMAILDFPDSLNSSGKYLFEKQYQSKLNLIQGSKLYELIINAKAENIIFYSVTDKQGNSLQNSKCKKISAGKNVIPIDVSHYTHGLYQIVLMIDGNSAKYDFTI